MKRKIGVGTTSFIERVFIRDTSQTSKVVGLTGLTNASGSLTCYYFRAGATTSSVVSLAAGTLGTWSSGGFKEMDATNMPGWYEVGIPNAAIASGAASVGFHLRGATNMEDIAFQFELDAVNYQDATRFGLSAMPNAAAAATGGLPIVGTGTGAINPSGGKVPATLAAGDVAGNLPADIQTIKTQTVTAAAGVTFPASIGTSTYAGTAVASVTGNVGGNVVGSVGSVVAGVTLGTNDSPVLNSGTALAGAASTITLAAGASATDGWYVGEEIKITGNTGAGQVRTISNYVGSTKVATVSRAWTLAPDTSSNYAVIAADALTDTAGTTTLLTRVPAAAALAATALTNVTWTDARAALMDKLVGLVVLGSGTASAGGSTGTFTITGANLVPSTAAYTNALLIWQPPSGLSTERRLITSHVYSGGNHQITVSPPYTAAPASGDLCILI